MPPKHHCCCDDSDCDDIDLSDMKSALIFDKKKHLEALTPKANLRLHALKGLHAKYSELEAKFQEELEALLKKYDDLYAPIYDRRAQITSGESEPTEEESAGYEPKEAKEGEKAPETEVAGIPDFWYHVLCNNDAVREITTLSETDKEALSYLVDIRCTQLPRTKISSKELTSLREDDDDEEVMVTRIGFEILFKFKPNPFFKETELKKTYYMVEDPCSREPMFDHAECIAPTWNEGKNLTVHKVTKTQTIGKKGGKRGGKRGGGAPQKRTITVEEPCPSFFSFFKVPELPKIDENLDRESIEEFSALVQEDFEVGCEIRDKVCPIAFLWYIGEAEGDEDGDDEDDYDDFDEDDYDDEDDDEDDEDEDDEDDDDEDDDKPATASTTQNPENPECKQQ